MIGIFRKEGRRPFIKLNLKHKHRLFVCNLTAFENILPVLWKPAYKGSFQGDRLQLPKFNPKICRPPIQSSGLRKQNTSSFYQHFICYILIGRYEHQGLAEEGVQHEDRMASTSLRANGLIGTSHAYIQPLKTELHAIPSRGKDHNESSHNAIPHLRALQEISTETP